MTVKTAVKTAVVTGASKGIGLAVTRFLEEDGFRVVGAARTVTPELKEASSLAVSVDLATPQGPAELIRQAHGAFGSVDVLVNNVGAFSPRTSGFAAIDDAEWQHTFELNFFGVVRTVRAALPHLVASQGSIVNVSSARARGPQPPTVDYGAAKAALTNLSKALSMELGPKGIRVNTVSPGPTRTPAWTDADGFGAGLAAAAGKSLEEFLEGFPGMAGLTTGRLTEPEEVAEVVRMLASGRTRAVNGADFVIDGGQLKTV
ncbi:SDR family oxidoreductase [Streptomyces sp. 769]|uniref:SDR family oxidoreductase n=1 Tax=Streptomyces sp. 769 TaxID=1262452 RepID=UPI00057E85E6|nr:SDR family oxidoreductase [Streptomyces sp. 769]AJC53141.1 short chain dehydrogenase/reductase family oxidoreductase [Streptomyces sp. 769]